MEASTGGDVKIGVTGSMVFIAFYGGERQEVRHIRLLVVFDPIGIDDSLSFIIDFQVAFPVVYLFRTGFVHPENPFGSSGINRSFPVFNHVVIIRAGVDGEEGSISERLALNRVFWSCGQDYQQAYLNTYMFDESGQNC